MITVPLQIRPSDKQQREATAWLLPGGDSQEWLRAIAAWPVRHTAVRIFVLPSADSHSKPYGAIVTLAAGDDSSSAGPVGAAPYGQPTTRLFVPVDARFEPGVTAAELASLLADDRTYVWRPQFGLVGFEPSDALRVADLAKTGPRRECDWRRASPGVALAGRLLGLTATQLPSVAEILSEGKEDIGSEPSSLKSLPPFPGESRAPDVKRWLSWLLLPLMFLLALFARMIAWLTSLVPATGQQRNWINRLEDWARQKMRPKPRPALTPSQQRELDRLLHLLEHDPDQGLRFAIPLFANNPRGVDAASGKLKEHDADFQLSRLVGGGRAAAWQASVEVQTQLVRRYRDLANRELSLGRHRRAAYIFAELLHDMPSAARALSAGGHWRDAAVLYRDRLKNNHEAARCLEQGGLYTEAIELLETMQRYEQAGDLYQKIGQSDAAAVAYRRQVSAHLSQDERVAAAMLLETKLADPNEALGVLDRGWPDGKHPLHCLQASFDLLARTGRAEEVTPRLSALRTTYMTPRVSQDLHGVLVHVANSFPDDAVRAQAGDVSRLLVADAWEKLSTEQRRELASSVARLSPADRLLRRDCARVTESMATAPLLLPRPARKQALREAKWVRQLRANGLVRWQKAVASGEGIFLAGWQEDEVVVERKDWLDPTSFDTLRWRANPSASGCELVLACDPQTGSRVLVHPVGHAPLPVRQFSPGANEVPNSAGGIADVSAGLMAAAFTATGQISLLESTATGLTLRTIDRRGDLVATRPLESTVQSLTVFMHVRHDCVYLASYEDVIACHSQGNREVKVELDAPICSLAGIAQHARLRMAVGLKHCAAMWWDSIDANLPTYVALDLETPIVEFNLAGQLIVAGAHSAEIYNTSQGRAELLAQCSGWPGRAIAVLRCPTANEFAIVTTDGVITIYRVD